MRITTTKRTPALTIRPRMVAYDEGRDIVKVYVGGLAYRRIKETFPVGEEQIVGNFQPNEITSGALRGRILRGQLMTQGPVRVKVVQSSFRIG